MTIDSAATNAFRDAPFAFLADNLILGPAHPALRRNFPEPMALRDEATKWGWSAYIADSFAGRFRPCGLYAVVKAENSPAFFNAYVADYEIGEAIYTTLGNDMTALFCFTANMNGCTFGIGSQTAANGALVVSHINERGNPDLEPAENKVLKASAQLASAKELHGIGGKVFQAKDYRDSNEQSTTFLVRAPNERWKLYCMPYVRQQAGRHETYGFQRAPTNTIR